ncbi:pentapeptide repeat-containing protein [Candidatus Protochlamydia sp. W-9]|uniref:pentapeptide repeat-containing protein n=1 Tax=Candidatus Protochlamydia sp. W-9 TaxID=1785087 RepID=UPI0021006C80|nr:pentapeptide repeat-containing protein [Candidatus Protochlamydia sp. W-9]
MDKANFSRANLEGADFTGCSLEDAILDNAELRDVQFGQLPYLNHQDKVLTMALSPNSKYLASVDCENFYIWNLETFEAEKQPLEIRSLQQSFLQFFQNGQFLFRASNKKGKRLKKQELKYGKLCP